MFSGISSLLSTIYKKICLVCDNVGNGFSHLGSKISSLGTSIGNYFSELGTSISSNFSNCINKVGNFFIDLGTSIGVFFNNLIGKLGEFFGTIGNYITGGFKEVCSGLTSLVNFFLSFFDTLLEFIKRLFVPRESYFTDNFNSLKEGINNKFNVDSSLLTGFSGSVGSISPQFKYDFSVLGVPVSFDYSFVDKIVPTCNTVFGGLTAIFLVWYHIKNALLLIRGTSMIEGGNISVCGSTGIEFKGSDVPVGSSAPTGSFSSGISKGNGNYKTTNKYGGR